MVVCTLFQVINLISTGLHVHKLTCTCPPKRCDWQICISCINEDPKFKGFPDAGSRSRQKHLLIRIICHPTNWEIRNMPKNAPTNHINIRSK